MTFTPEQPTQRSWPARIAAPWAVVLLVVLLSVVGRFWGDAPDAAAGNTAELSQSIDPENMNPWLMALSLGIMGVGALALAAAVYALVTTKYWRARYQVAQDLRHAESGIWGFGLYFLCFVLISLGMTAAFAGSAMNTSGTNSEGQSVELVLADNVPAKELEQVNSRVGESSRNEAEPDQAAINSATSEMPDSVDEAENPQDLSSPFSPPSLPQLTDHSEPLAENPPTADPQVMSPDSQQPASIAPAWNWLLALATLIPLLWLRWRHGRQHTSEVLGTIPLNQWALEAFAGLRIYFACIPALLVLMIISLSLIDDHGSHPIEDMIPAEGDVIGWLVLASIAVIMAPVTEELTFRGLLYHHCRGWMRYVPAAVITGIIFAVIHPQGLAAMPVLAAMGFILATIREARGNIIAPIVAHAAHNGMIMGMLYFAHRGGLPGL